MASPIIAAGLLSCSDQCVVSVIASLVATASLFRSGPYLLAVWLTSVTPMYSAVVIVSPIAAGSLSCSDQCIVAVITSQTTTGSR